MRNTNSGGLSRRNNPLITRALVVLDAGKGGEDSGLTDSGLKEKDVNLAVCYFLAGYLLTSQIGASMVRYSDTTMGIEERARIANDLSPDIVVSVNLRDKGTPNTIYYWGYDGNAEIAATFLCQHIQNWGALGGIRAKKERTGLVGKTYAPCVHIAAGTLANLGNSEFVQAYADVLAHGLLESFTRIMWNAPQ